MSSLKNAAKSQKTHRERHQPAHRSQFGLLEKKKDYRLRAKDFNEKKETLLRLRKKALDKNPDEFYYHMINSQTEEGVHKEKAKESDLTPEQIALMQTRDLKYIVHKRHVENKKIEKLQATLHLIDANQDRPANKHTFFVDSEREKKHFNLAKRLNTHKDLVNRSCNIPKLSTLKKERLSLPDDSTEENLDILKRRDKAYKELKQRIERERQLGVIQAKMEVKRHLQKDKNKPNKVVVPESKNVAPVLKWPKERKK